MKNIPEASIHVVDPKTLSDLEFMNLNEVTQDMWAYGIGEFVQCNSCHEMHSKHDVFGHLPKDVYEMTAARVMGLLGKKEIECPSCGSDTRFIFGKENVENIKERLLDSEDSFLVVCKNDMWDIVGYVDGYVHSLEVIFQRELHYHYSEIWFEAVRTQVQKVLGYVPPSMISFSSMGLVEKHTNFFTIFNMLREFFHSIPEKRKNLPGITEADRGSSLYDMYVSVGGHSIGIDTVPEWREKIMNTGKTYHSDIIVGNDTVSNAIRKFSSGIRGYLKTDRRKKVEVESPVLLAA